MWTISAHEVLHLTPGGETFTRFVDALIRGQAFRNAVPDSQIATNLRTIIKDGGVDTEVKSPITGDDPTGYFGVPTCWQYKSERFAAITDSKLRKELKGHYVRELIEKGYGYRLCICDDMPPDKKGAEKKKKGWLKLLKEEIQKINPLAPEPFVVVASDLAAWTNRLPAIIPQFFRPDLDNLTLHMDAWGSSVASVTPKYIANPVWEGNRTAILNHIDFTQEPADVVLSITGQAGVGKTRMVYETLKENPGCASVLLCPVTEETAQSLAATIANDPSRSAILLVDDCSLNTRVKLRSVLRGRPNVRAITIDNFAQRQAGPNPEFHLERMPRELVEQILRANFQFAPADVIRAALDLAGGFILIAADLCKNFATPSFTGELSDLPYSLKDYVHRRLDNKEEVDCLKAISLLRKVGFRDEVAEELRTLCAVLNLNYQTILDTAKQMKGSPGFVVQAGRYFYVTPEIIARFAFEQAWETWAEHQVKEFLTNFPPSLLQSFQERVAQSATDHIRSAVSDFFRHWAANLTPPMLQKAETVDQLESLIETDPSTHLPTLRRLVESASKEELLAIKGDYRSRHSADRNGRWGPRRRLVWLTERLASFPEYFYDAEAILFHLARAESEPNIGNNATAIWRQLFRIQLSGTPVPFPDRIKLLELRFAESNLDERHLLFSALDEALGYVSGRMLGPAVVAGRIPPQEWSPRTVEEERECYQLATEMLVHLVDTGDDETRMRAMLIGQRSLNSILFQQLLEEAVKIFPKEATPSALLPDLLSEIEDFLNFEGAKGRPLSQEYLERVRQWKEQLAPADFHGKLVSAAGQNPWNPRSDDERHQDEIESLARELYRSPAQFESEIPWLYSGEAKSAVFLGEAFGRVDSTGKYMSKVFCAAVQHQASAFARGYVLGLLKSNSRLEKPINKHLDQLERDDSQIAFELFVTAGPQTNAVERTIRSIQAGALPPEYIRGLLNYAASVSAEEFCRLMSTILPFVRQGNQDAAGAAITLLAYQLYREKNGTPSPLLESASVRDLVWELVDFGTDAMGRESHWWEKVIQALAEYEPERAYQAAARALVSESYSLRKMAEKLLAEHAGKRPHEVMNALGEIMLDKSLSWHFFVHKYRSPIKALPLSVVTSWLEKAGVEAARKIARSLPPPRLDANGQAVVPPLTEWVLDKFEADDQVFREYLAGTMSDVSRGDFAAVMREKADIAAHFSNHRLRRIRQWASEQSKRCEKEAEWWQQRHEEDLLIR